MTSLTLRGGIVPPIVTPLADRDTLDVAGLERLLDHVLAGGVHGVFPLGTTGEAPSLSRRLRAEVVRETCRRVAGRAPVLVGITDPAYVESLELAKVAAEAGAQAVVLSSPYYYPMAQADLCGYVERLAAESPLPILLYNIPQNTRTPFAAETVRRLMDVPNIVGMKDSSGDDQHFRQLLDLLPRRPGWLLFMGPDTRMGQAVLDGAQGGVNAGANLHPRLYVDVYEAAAAGDRDRVAALQPQVLRIGEALYRIRSNGSAISGSLKCALSLLGICRDVVAEPFCVFSAEERARVQRVLADLGLSA